MFPAKTNTRVTSKGPASRNASSGSALRGIDDAGSEIVKQAAKAIPYLIVGGIVVYGIHSYMNRFIKLKENSAYPVANVTLAQATTKANAIKAYSSFDDVSNNLAGLNYNGFVRVYNAFGQSEGSSSSSSVLFGLLTVVCPPCGLLSLTGGGNEGDMIGWIKSEFSEDQVNELSFLFNGQFF